MVMKPYFDGINHTITHPSTAGTFRTELQLIIPQRPQRHEAGGITQNDVGWHVLIAFRPRRWLHQAGGGFHETQLELYKEYI